MEAIKKSNTMFLNSQSRSYAMAKANLNKPFILIFNEPEEPEQPFQWAEGALLTREAYIAFIRLATPFECATHSYASIDAEMAAMGRWEPLTATCVKELYATVSTQ